MSKPSPELGLLIGAFIAYSVAETIKKMADRPRNPGSGIPAPTKKNPMGGDPNEPPATTNDPSKVPVDLLPPAANTTYETSINQYPRGGFCGVNVSARYDPTGQMAIKTVAWAPEMDVYGTLSGCLGRPEVRGVASKYWAPQDVSYYDRGMETSGVVWVTPDPYPNATHDPSYTPPSTFDTGQGCYFFDVTTGSIKQEACPWIVPMGTPAERATHRTDITPSTNMWQEFGKQWFGWS